MGWIPKGGEWERGWRAYLQVKQPRLDCDTTTRVRFEEALDDPLPESGLELDELFRAGVESIGFQRFGIVHDDTDGKRKPFQMKENTEL